MGLDMYLYANKYESLHSWQTEDEKKIDRFYPRELQELTDRQKSRNFLSKETKYQIGYWRKANAIHKWFIDNCADGVDDCNEVYVSKEKINALLNIVNEVLNNIELGKELLPTSEGFFFGSQKYDEWYIDDLKYTRCLLEQVKKLLEKDNKYHIIYQASW